MDCPECAKRPYLCFEHHEELRVREEDELTLGLFADLWDARMKRETRFAENLAKTAWHLGRKVAKGEMLLAKATEMLKHRIHTVDETMPIFAYMLPIDAAEQIVTEAFALGYRSVARRRRA